MFTFFGGIVCLILGYLIYGKITERIFGIEPERPTPCYTKQDGVDYIPMDWKKVFLIQYLNIDGTGAIFGAITGAYFGPAAYLWIVFGCIFGGAVHDFSTGMLSVRNGGASISEIVGKYLGKTPRYIIRVLSLLLMIFVGALFVTTPAQVLRELIVPDLSRAHLRTVVFIILIAAIIAYYILATMLPIDKLIGRIYPLFGAALVFMAAGLFVMLIVTGEIRSIPEFAFQNLNPGVLKEGIFTPSIMTKHVFPFLFITVACGAISGFHATQSPLMARCMKNERNGRRVFYLTMVLEGVVAMIWASVAMAHFGGNHGLVAAGSPAVVVSKSAVDLMGIVGGAIAVIGVAVAPITTGDTAFRSARIHIAEILKLSQKPFKNRFLIALPLFALGIFIVIYMNKNTENFNVIWRYNAWANQTLAAFGLWAAATYLAQSKRFYVLTLLPALFMTFIVTTYLFTSNECLGPAITLLTKNDEITYCIGLAIGLAAALTSGLMFVLHYSRSAHLKIEDPFGYRFQPLKPE